MNAGRISSLTIALSDAANEERWDSLQPSSSGSVASGLEQRPLLDRRVEEILHHGDGPAHRGHAGDAAVREAASQGRQLLPRVAGHLAPAGQHRSPSSGVSRRW